MNVARSRGLRGPRLPRRQRPREAGHALAQDDRLIRSRTGRRPPRPRGLGGGAKRSGAPSRGARRQAQWPGARSQGARLKRLRPSSIRLSFRILHFERPRPPERGPLIAPARGSYAPVRTAIRIQRSGTVLCWSPESMGRCRVMGRVHASSNRMPRRYPAHLFRPRQHSGSHCHATHSETPINLNHNLHYNLVILSNASATSPTPRRYAGDPRRRWGLLWGGPWGSVRAAWAVHQTGLWTRPGPRLLARPNEEADARLLAAKSARDTQVPWTRLAGPRRQLPGPSSPAISAA